MYSDYCPTCQEKTDHQEIIKQRPSKHGTDKKGQRKAFWEGFFHGWFSSFDASIDLADRYAKCQKCGYSRLDNKGQEFQ